jgi:septal ring factor EnvC (AmiA/AmiB activator)
MTDTSNTTIYELADQFIALANQLSQQEADVGKVGTALRFAAARFNAFEAAIKSADLGAEKESALEWFSSEFKEMLSDNLDDHIANPPIIQESVAEEADNSVQMFKG